MLISYVKIRIKLATGAPWKPKTRVLSDFWALKGGIGDMQKNASHFDNLQVFGVVVNFIRVLT